MAVIGIGTDLCSIDRWQAMCERRPAVVERILTPAERDLSPSSQAARWAAKEALAKALGAPAGMAWSDCEIVRDELGAPHFELQGTVQARADELGITHIHLSISHDGGMATALVVCEAR
ncbi:holo-ACP synthase [Luteococcus sp. Sow4_B9]|uniref:holo-ACP synthase n=1 Tax=Luteococcus sp. Sow4_B9 TaxID=3438792 RepID=UPI003F9BEFE9